MKQEEIVEILTKTGCLEGYGEENTSIDSMRLLEDPIVTNRLAVELLQQLPEDTKLDTILCLHNDEMLFAYSVATAAWARFVYADENEGSISLINGQSINKDSKVLIIDDVLDDSSCVNALVEEMKKSKAKVIGVASLFSYLSEDELDVPSFTLLSLKK